MQRGTVQAWRTVRQPLQWLVGPQGEPRGEEKLGWRNSREPHGAGKVTSRMKGP